MEQTRLISALKAQAIADKEKALMALELLTKHDKLFITLDKWRELQVNKILNYE